MISGTKEKNLVEIYPQDVHAVIFDLDGVVTKTADVHAKAWKKIFDRLLKNLSFQKKSKFVPFDAVNDYLKYVDGKPRTEGIRSFLESRGITLPVGTEEDNDNLETICGIATLKNSCFLDEIMTNGVEVYVSTVQLIKNLRAEGVKTAIISSSCNCAPILASVNLTHLFDYKVDGVDAKRLNIPGKPAPDVFLLAAEHLNVLPDQAYVVEDAISGVQAGRAGKFKKVIGVDRGGHREALLSHGADVVVNDLREVKVVKNKQPRIPKRNALKFFDDIKKRMEGRKPIFFFDFDGTLVPITLHPSLVSLDSSMYKRLNELSKMAPCAIVSGRDREDVQEHVNLDDVYYAGSHGFDILTPSGQHFDHPEGQKAFADLDKARRSLERKLIHIDGAWVERKRFAVAVHFRQVSSLQESLVEAVVDSVSQEHPFLKKSYGKKIYELRPNINWHKGKAIEWIIDILKEPRENFLIFYFGDDYTDEDAFQTIKGEGIGIAIQESPKKTAAEYTLRSPLEVKDFLKKIIAVLNP